MKKILTILLIAFLVMPLLSADIIDPNSKPVSISNKITNIADFSDYSFLAVCTGPMPAAFPIGEDGVIPNSCYKFSGLSVYAVKNSDFIKPYTDLTDYSFYSYNEDLFLQYLNSSRFIEVISNIEHYKMVPLASTQDAINNEYQINVSQLISNPDNSEVTRNNLKYVYIGIPIVALIIIVIILIRRRK